MLDDDENMYKAKGTAQSRSLRLSTTCLLRDSVNPPKPVDVLPVVTAQMQKISTQVAAPEHPMRAYMLW